MEPTRRDWRLKVGGATPLLFVSAILVLSFLDRGYLHSSGWSAVRRTPVEWPSLLLLGPHRVAATGAFVLCGLGGLLLGWALFSAAHRRRDRLQAILILALGATVCLLAFPPDTPASSHHTWQGEVHNLIYPIIPVAGLTGLSVSAFSHRTLEARAAWGLLPLASLAAILTFGDAMAQLARFFLFAAILAWLTVVARETQGRGNRGSG